MDAAYRLVVAMALVLVVLVGIRLVMGPGGAPASPTPTVLPPSAYLYPEARVAPVLPLVNQDGDPFDPALLAGGPTLVYFGYTHCPDVCPATIGIVSEVMAAYGPALRAIFVTVDPERDTVPWLADYVRYLPAGFTALTGTAAQVRMAADAWGVRYARVETGTAGEYSMSHTAEVYLVDGAGCLRAHFPFGTDAAAMLATVRLVTGSGPVPTVPATIAPSPVLTSRPSGPPAEQLSLTVVSTSIWSGGTSPVILWLSGPAGQLRDLAAFVTVELWTDDGRVLLQTARATAVQPPKMADVSYVATLDIPTPGWWRLAVTAESGGVRLFGTTTIRALDPGSTVALGGPAPTVRTPTLADVEGRAMAITTDPVPDPRLYSVSTVDALAAHRPFVMVVDSEAFKVTEYCGHALYLVKVGVDRWPTVDFIHLEPFVYDVAGESPVLRGSLESPMLVPAAAAWGLDSEPWGPTMMPWVFVVDGNGVVRAKYQGIFGGDDMHNILALVLAGG